jgi:membrane peptidoglycan carboxypeptidase
MMRPYVVSEVRDASGNLEKRNTPRFVRQVIRSETAEEITAMLEGVVEYGTGEKAAIKGYRVAGKTGTAQKPNLEEGGYYRDKYVAVFAGFVPARNPVACIAVVVDSPQGKHYGGQVAAPAFRKIAKDILQHLEIPPTEKTEQSHSKPEGPPSSASGRADGGREILFVRADDADSFFEMPDVTGRTMKAISSSSLGRLALLEFDGSGVAFRQIPAAGRVVEKGGRCRIFFKRIDAK